MTRFNFASGVCSGGDAADSTTYEWVGRVLSQWEALEFELSRLFAALMNDPDGPTMQFYGTGKTIVDRTNFLRIAFDNHFIATPNQDHEGEVDAVLEDMNFAADRRNEVAHGIVFNVSLLQSLHALMGTIQPPSGNVYVLVPAYYATKRHKGGLPAYAYSSSELRKLHSELVDLQKRVRPIRHRLRPDLWQTERREP